MIFLTGLAGSGKSTAGKRLAAKLGWKFADTDSLVKQHAKMGIAKIFQIKGEREFRRLESRVLRSLKHDKTVVATGGGIVLKASNRAWMKRHGAVVHLSVGIKALEARLNSTELARRPLLAAGSRSLREMARKRAKYYRQADIKIQAALPLRTLVSKICLKIKEKRPQVLHDKTAR